MTVQSTSVVCLAELCGSQPIGTSSAAGYADSGKCNGKLAVCVLHCHALGKFFHDSPTSLAASMQTQGVPVGLAVSGQRAYQRRQDSQLYHGQA